MISEGAKRADDTTHKRRCEARRQFPVAQELMIDKCGGCGKLPAHQKVKRN